MKYASAGLDTGIAGKFLVCVLLALPLWAQSDACGWWNQADSVWIVRIAPGGKAQTMRVYKGSAADLPASLAGLAGSHLVYARQGSALRMVAATGAAGEIAFLDSLPKGGVRLLGQVVREVGLQPVERASITVEGHGQKFHAVSGDGGGFQIPVAPPGQYIARAERAGYHSGEAPVSAGNGCATVRVALRPDAARLWLEDALSSVKSVARAAYYAARDTIHSRKR
jgi:hypothetical protein